MVTLTSHWASPRELQATDYEVELKVASGFHALTAVNVRSAAFWDVTLSNSVQFYLPPASCWIIA